MIKNIIFDIGNVLAAFNWKEVYDRIFDKDTAEKVAKATVLNTEAWQELDRSVLSDEEIFRNFYSAAPECREQIDRGIAEIYRSIRPYPYASEWLKTLKDKGCGIYILSNYGKTSFEMSRENFEFLKYADGGVISYEIGVLKPEKDIYLELCRRYGLTPEECVFIDDSQANIEAAEKLGFKGIHFKGKDEACTKLRAMGVDI